MSRKEERHNIRLTPDPRGRRRPRKHVVRQAHGAVVAILIIYAIVAVAVIHARYWSSGRRAADVLEAWPNENGDPRKPETGLQGVLNSGGSQ